MKGFFPPPGCGEEMTWASLVSPPDCRVEMTWASLIYGFVSRPGCLCYPTWGLVLNVVVLLPSRRGRRLPSPSRRGRRLPSPSWRRRQRGRRLLAFGQGFLSSCLIVGKQISKEQVINALIHALINALIIALINALINVCIKCAH